MTLYIAEKPSVGKDIARVLGANTARNGYLEGKDCLVTWALGHLVSLAEPEAYGYRSRDQMYADDAGRAQAQAELPLLPGRFKLVVPADKKNQFEVVKTLFHRPDVELVVDCGDMGAEGHILQWLIREKAGCPKPLKRFCATSMTDEAIRHALENLREISDFEGVVAGEWCKKRADWILGMSLSRAATLRHHANVTVGRVQSPTLFFVVKRFIEHSQFKVSDYFQISADCGGFSVTNDTKYGTKSQAESGANLPASGTVQTVETKPKTVNPPGLYDITELQRDANRSLGFGAEKTLKIAQSLYEKHKILSYPRTDSRHLTQDLVPVVTARVGDLAKLEPYQNHAQNLIENGLVWDKRLVDDTKVTDHHALIPTENLARFDFAALDAEKAAVLRLVLVRLLVSLSPKHLFDETKCTVRVGETDFSASGKIVSQEGWKTVQSAFLDKSDNKADEKEVALPPLQPGQTLPVASVSVLAKKTTPPKLHTEATLLTAMENAGAKLENGAVLKGKGIGTQATRAAIIASLFGKGYIAETGTGKAKNLVPTKAGLSVIKALPSELYSPQITADWETKIAEIANKNAEPEGFMADFEAFARQMLDLVLTRDCPGVDFRKEREKVCECGACGSPVYAGKRKQKDGEEVDVLYCSGENCKVSVAKTDRFWLAVTGKNLTSAQMKTLASGKSVTADTTNKNGRTVKKKFSLQLKENGFWDIREGEK